MTLFSVAEAKPSELQLEAHALIQKYHPSKPSSKDLNEGALQGIVQAVSDPYTQYLPPAVFRQLKAQHNGKLVGIGIEIGQKGNEFYILSVYPNSPAAKKGLSPMDKLLKINGTPIQTVSQAESMLLGPPKSTLTLTIRRSTSGKNNQVTLMRAHMRSYNIQNEAIFYESVGYLHITKFNAELTKNLVYKLQSLRRKGMNSLIIDLRNNAGGQVREAINAAGLFMKDALVTQIYYPRKASQYRRTSGPAPYSTLPLVILIDKSTASAAEIFAAALKENNRATVIGSSSFGKSAVQQLFPLKNGGALLLTTAYFLTPSGKNLLTVGLEPTIELNVPSGIRVNYEDDLVLREAIDYALVKFR